MRRWADAAFNVLLTLWVGGLWVIGYVAAPLLFHRLENKVLAGNLAGDLFNLIAWIGFAAGAFLFCYCLVIRRWSVLKSPTFWLVAIMLLLTAVGHFGIQPLMAELKEAALPRQVMESALRDRFATWHGISSVLYLIQSLLGLVLVLRASKSNP